MATENAEDYLERIYELIQAKGYARVVDIAEALGLAQASVTQMTQRLADRGFLVYEKYRGVTLTPEGKRVAKTIRRRHEVLRDFFDLLGVEENTAMQDIEGIEHHLSPDTLARIEGLVGLLRDHTRLRQQISDSRRALKR